MYERRIYERTTGAAAAFVNGTSDDIIDVGQFSVQHCGQLFCSEDQRGCDDSSVACLSDPEFCKCGSHRFWRGNQCGDRVLSRRKGTGQGKCSSVKGYSSFCCSWCDHDSSLYSDHAGISADAHIE